MELSTDDLFVQKFETVDGYRRHRRALEQLFSRRFQFDEKRLRFRREFYDEFLVLRLGFHFENKLVSQSEKVKTFFHFFFTF